MNIHLSIERYLKFTLALLFATCIFDPADQILKLKLPLFLILILVGFFDFIKNGLLINKHHFIYLFLFGIIIPIYGILVGENFGDKTYGFDGYKYLYSYLFIFYSLFIIKSEILIFARKILLSNLIILAHIILIIFILYFIFKQEYLVDTGIKYGNFHIGGKQYSGVSFNTIYYTSSALLVYSFSELCQSVKVNFKLSQLYFLIITTLAMLITGTRNMYIVTFIILFYYFGIARSGVLVAFGICFFIMYNYENVISSMLSSDDISNALKISYINDYIEIFESPFNLIVGQGLGVKFYSTGLGDYLSITELTYFDIFRYYGIFIGGMLLILILSPNFYLYKKKYNSLLVGYLAYLYLCSLNPYLFSSNGILLMGLIIVYAFKNKI